MTYPNGLLYTISLGLHTSFSANNYWLRGAEDNIHHFCALYKKSCLKCSSVSTKDSIYEIMATIITLIEGPTKLWEVTDRVGWTPKTSCGVGNIQSCGGQHPVMWMGQLLFMMTQYILSDLPVLHTSLIKVLVYIYIVLWNSHF